MSEQKPTVGRIVHYQSHGSPDGKYTPQPRAAVVTAISVTLAPGSTLPSVGEPTSAVDLCVLNPEGMYFNRGVPFSETPQPGHWNWPPRA